MASNALAKRRGKPDDPRTGKTKNNSDAWRTPDGLLRIKGMAREGMIDQDIAANMGIHPDTLWKWKKKYPDILNAINEGRRPAVEEIVDTLYKAAKGYYAEDVDTRITQTPDGKEKKEVTKHKRWIKPEPSAIYYILNNRRPDAWSSQYNVKGASAVGDAKEVVVVEMQRKNAPVITPDGQEVVTPEGGKTDGEMEEIVADEAGTAET